MKLRVKFLLGVLPLLLIIVALGLFAVFLFSELEDHFEQVQRENLPSMGSAWSIIETASMLHQAAEQAEMDNREEAIRTYNLHSADLKRHLDQMARGIEGVDDAPMDKLRQRVHAFDASVNAVVLTPGEIPIAQEAVEDVDDQLAAIALLTSEIQSMNVNLLRHREGQVLRWSSLSKSLFVFGVLAAVVTAFLISLRLANHILRPVEELTGLTQKIAQGNLALHAKADSNDEMADLGLSINHMTAQLRQFRELADDRLMRTQQTMRSTFDNLPDPLFFVSGSGDVVLQNERARKLFSDPDWQEGIPEELGDMIQQTLADRGEVITQTMEEVMVLREGSDELFVLPKILTVDSSPAYEVGGQREKLAAVLLQDVTKMRLAEDVKTDLVSTVSHELKTPLTSARMSLCMLEEESFGELTNQQRELVRTSRLELERQLRVIDAFLDLSRMESKGSGHFLRGVCNPMAIAEGAVENIAELADISGVTVKLEAQPGLPDIVGDCDRLGVVLDNLLSNAIKFSPPGGEINLRVRRRDGHVCFLVSDQGPGIEEENRSSIFRRFYKVPGQTKGGAGLGLSIAREIVLAHGGDVGLETEPGKGSVFSFCIPTVDGRAHASQRRRRAAPAQLAGYAENARF